MMSLHTTFVTRKGCRYLRGDSIETGGFKFAQSISPVNCWRPEVMKGTGNYAQALLVVQYEIIVHYLDAS